MKTKIFTIVFICIKFVTLPVYASCSEGNEKNTNYIRRQNPNRCEGILRERFIGSSPNLVSFSTGEISSFSGITELELQVPNIKNREPDVQVSTESEYRLDEFNLLTKLSGYFSFSWPAYVINKEKIQSEHLWFQALLPNKTQDVWLPVIFGKPSGTYKFTVFSESRIHNFKYQIKRGDQIIYEGTRQPDKEIDFRWDGSREPAGRYKLIITGATEVWRRSPEKFLPISIEFEHDPNWLK